MDFGAFREDPKTIAAVERKLQLITEAAIRLGDAAERLCPGLPWRNIRGLGNWLRHQYDRIDLKTVWLTVTEDLPALRQCSDSTLEVVQAFNMRDSRHYTDLRFDDERTSPRARN